MESIVKREFFAGRNAICLGLSHSRSDGRGNSFCASLVGARQTAPRRAPAPAKKYFGLKSERHWIPKEPGSRAAHQGPDLKNSCAGRYAVSLEYGELQ